MAVTKVVDIAYARLVNTAEARDRQLAMGRFRAGAFHQLRVALIPLLVGASRAF
jgi:hypothetical protein